MGHTLLLYDGECHFCRWGIHVLARLDRRGALGFCPFGHPVAEQHLSQLASDERYSSFHAVVGGRLFSAADAARRALEVLPLGRLAVLLGVHRLYPLIAANRAVLGRLVPSRGLLDTCTDVPEGVGA
ncbi:MAG TPA: DUF393 domain-containing protein [Actinomycetota bacterium]|nr:DUF393 domain-containing protein [Actinomycetota bacterium]